MGDPLTVVILVAAGRTTDPATLAIERAAGEALGHTARVVVREAMGTPTDGEALALESEASEAAVAEVTWGDPTHRVATVRVHFSGHTRWLDRTIGFGPADIDAERGRTIGFALVSMLPETRTPEPTAPPAVALPPPPPPPVVVHTPLEPDVSPEANAGKVRYALDLVGVGAAALGADLQTAGGGAALDVEVVPWLSVRIGGAIRAGKVMEAQARSLALFASAGLSLHPWPSSPTKLFSAALRVDYVLMNQTVTHYSATGADVSTRARTLSGIDVLLESEWRLGKGVDVLAGAGIEDVMATTYMDLNGVRVATLPPLNGIAEVGMRLRF
ncbi:MAG TPA: hypothetical protein VH044_19945 [Polyangiaceae bacterium]|jgi:hypothetical protein|nr:hypothetical protein [Polyangiaceae bacterium]